MKRLAIIALLIATPALAQQATPSLEDYQAALAEANAQISGLSQRAEQMAVSIAQSARKIADLQKQIDAAKPKEEAPRP